MDRSTASHTTDGDVTTGGQIDGGPWGIVTIAEAAASVRASARLAGRTIIVAVDGRSGAGKSTVADELALSLGGAPVIRTDDVAWHHSFFDWWPMMRAELLEPIQGGRAVSWRPPAWVDRGRDGSIDVPAADVVIVEGVSASRQELWDLLDAAIWVHGDPAEQERRGVLRDGGDAAAERFWAEWQSAERPLLAADRPWERADLLVLGTPAALPPMGSWWARWGPGGRLRP